MKTILIFSVTVLMAVSGFAKKKQSLFNGKDLAGWYIYVNDTQIDPNKYFYVNNGTIETVGVLGWLFAHQKRIFGLPFACRMALS